MPENAKKPMSEEKQKRLVVAVTAACVLLAFFLLIILIIQFVQIGVKRTYAKELEQELEKVDGDISSAQEALDSYNSQDQLYILLLKNGYRSHN